MTTAIRAVLESEDLSAAGGRCGSDAGLDVRRRQTLHLRQQALAGFHRANHGLRAWQWPGRRRLRRGSARRASRSSRRRSTGDSRSGWSIGCGATTVNTGGCSIAGFPDSTATVPLPATSRRVSTSRISSGRKPRALTPSSGCTWPWSPASPWAGTGTSGPVVTPGSATCSRCSGSPPRRMSEVSKTSAARCIRKIEGWSGRRSSDARRNRTPYVAEFRVRWPDGTVRWVAATGKFLYAADGEPERMLGMSVDITERKQAEESLRRKEMELTEAQRLAGVGSWQWDPDSDTVVWSEELYRIAGRDPESASRQFQGSSATVQTGKLGTVAWRRRRGTPHRHAVRARRGDGPPRRHDQVAHGSW